MDRPRDEALDGGPESTQQVQHLPVLLEETLALLAPERLAVHGGGLFVDCTLGLGGHAEALLRRHPEARLVGIDRDPRALQRAARRLESFRDRVRFVEGRFSQIRELLNEIGIEQVSGGILADLGVSSMQLDLGERGFSFQNDGPLDMRMGQPANTACSPGDELDDKNDDEWTAREVLRHYPEDALKKMLRDYGEEPQAARIARAIVARRNEQPLETTTELRQLIESVKTAPRRRPRTKTARRRHAGRPSSIHPATQTFQALRIEVNRELEELRHLIDESVDLLDSEGRLVVISYHSLEDRIVKHGLRHLAVGEIEPVTGRTRAETQLIEVLTKKPVRPADTEVAANPRSRSARLRAAKRL